jgi:hypothetical protein
MAERFQEVLGLDTLFGGWGSPNLSPQVRQRINEVVEQEMALLSARGETYTDIADLRNRAAETLAGSIYIMNDVVYLRGSGPVTGDEMDLNMVPLGHGVRNPNTGEMEDTLSRMMEDVAGITDGFTGIVLDTDNISVRPTDYLSAHNGYQLIDNTTNRPLMIAVGETYQIDREYDETGAERWQAAVWWNGGDEVQFSGDAEHDQALMTQILPPGVSLLPHTDADGNVIAYEMFVAPRWEGQTRYTMEDLMQMADEGQLTIDQIPPDRRLEFLGRQMTQEMWDNGRMVRMTDAVETALGDEGIAEIEAYLEGVNNPEPAPVEEPVATGDFNQRLDTLITSYEETGVLDPAILASMPEWMHDMDPDLLMTVLYETQRLQNERN